MSSDGFTITQTDKIPQNQGELEQKIGDASPPVPAKTRSYQTQQPPLPALEVSNPPTPSPVIKPVVKPKPQTQTQIQIPPQKQKAKSRVRKQRSPDEEDELWTGDEEGDEEDDDDEKEEESDEEDEEGARGSINDALPQMKGMIPRPVGFPNKWYKIPIDQLILSGATLKRVASGAGKPDQLFFVKGSEQRAIGLLTTQWYNFIIRAYPLIVGDPDAWVNIISQIKTKRWGFGLPILTEDEKQAFKSAQSAMAQHEQKLGDDLGIKRESQDTGMRALGGLMEYDAMPKLRGSQMKSELRMPGLMVPKSVVLRKETLFLYAWAVENRGYDRTLGDFMNDCVEAYMGINGIKPAIVMNIVPEQNTYGYQVR